MKTLTFLGSVALSSHAENNNDLLFLLLYSFEVCRLASGLLLLLLLLLSYLRFHSVAFLISV